MLPKEMNNRAVARNSVNGYYEKHLYGFVIVLYLGAVLLFSFPIPSFFISCCILPAPSSTRKLVQIRALSGE